MDKDLWKYTGLLLGGALLGYSLNATLLITLLVAIIIIVWQTHRVNLIQKWLDNPSDNPMPEMGGLYYLIRSPEVEAMLNHKSALKEDQEISSLALNNQVINLKSIPYTDVTRMVIARDVSQLIKVNQMHTDFVANVSHELKTPLTVLKGYVEILQNSKELPEKFVKPLGQMNLQSVRMQFIVSDLLYLAKLEDTANKTPHQPVEVTHLINAIIESVQPLLEEKRHKIELDLDPNIRIIGAETELHSAFSNLITNAINYTEPHGAIAVRWKGQLEGAEFSVKDNGLGIPAHHISRLTQRFYRVDTDRSREGGGTGLGLAIVKHVLQRHNGELDIKSADGSGSTFICHFPHSQILNAEQSKVG